MVKAFRQAMEEGRHTADPVMTNYKSKYAVDWLPFLNRKWTDNADTARAAGRAQASGRPHHDDPAQTSSCTRWWRRSSPTAQRWARASSRSTGAWANTWPSPRWWQAAIAVRITGQDSGRGTFSHRHAVLHDQNREKWDAGSYVPLQNVVRQPGAVHRDRLGAVGGGGARLRVRLLDCRAQRAGRLGGAVRRLRQRRAGGDRPVHRSGEVKWGRQSRPDADAAARLRRPGTRALVGRAWSASCSCAADNNMQVAQPTTAGADLPSAAPADDPPVPQAAGHHDAEVAAASTRMRSRRCPNSPRAGSRPSSAPRREHRSEEGQARGRLLGQGVLRPGRPRATSASSTTWLILRVEQLYPFPHKAFAAELRKFPNVDRARLVPGRAAEPGRLVLRPAHICSRT